VSTRSPGHWLTLDPDPLWIPDRTGSIARAAEELIPHGERSGYAPSVTAAGLCPRRVGYRRLGIPATDPPEPRVRLLRIVGEAVERVLIDRLVAAGIAHSPGASVRIPYPYGYIHGVVDALVGDDAVLDVKTVASWLYGELCASGKPSPDNALQVNLYIHGLRIAGQERRRYGILLYLDRESGRLLDLWFEYSPALAENAVRTLTLIEERARFGLLLPRPEGFVPENPPCTWCPYRTLCWEGGQQS